MAQVFCDDAQVYWVLAQIEDAQGVVIAVYSQNLAAGLVNVVDKLEGGLKFISLVPKSVCALQFFPVFDVADTKSSGTFHLRSPVTVGTANVIFADGLGNFVGGMQDVAALDVLAGRPGKSSPRKASHELFIVGLCFLRSVQEGSSQNGVFEPNCLKR